jgi:hypothetical protein
MTVVVTCVVKLRKKIDSDIVLISIHNARLRYYEDNSVAKSRAGR